MSPIIELIQNGSVTSATGFVAGATYAGLKTEGDDLLDLGILKSEEPAVVAGVYSANKVLSPSVTLTKQKASDGVARAVVVNSGCANCCVGNQGMLDAEEMVSLAADHISVPEGEVLVCSTGLIGVELPMALIRQHIGNVLLNEQGGAQLARAIMTTDTRPKENAISLDISGRRVILGGVTKGSGMVHPNMATMLCFIATDAPVQQNFLQRALKESVNASFNMIDVDGDMSTNDTVLVFANGAAGGDEIQEGTAEGDAFQDALTYLCVNLAKELVVDAEGAQRLIEVYVDGAQSVDDARIAARTIASSTLVKAMVHGRDPNWGRVMMALGMSGANFEESNVDIYINDIHMVHEGTAFPYLKDAVINAMTVPEVRFHVALHEGNSSATAWGCDLTEEYVILNSAYST